MQYLFLDSDTSKDRYPNNKPYNFTNYLDKNIDLGSNTYYCALNELNFQDSIVEPLYIYCSIIESSYTKDSYYPILRTVDGESQSYIFNYPFFIKIKENNISEINIQILNSKGEFATVNGVTRLVLTIYHSKYVDKYF